MAKKITGYLKLQVPARSATAVAPDRPASASAASTSWNSARRSMPDADQGEGVLPTPVVITIFADKSFSFESAPAPVTYLHQEVAEPGRLVQKLSGKTSSAGTITPDPDP